MQRSLGGQLLALFLLLALVAGGDRFAAVAMVMDGGMQMSNLLTSDMKCESCDGTMADAPCDAACMALSAIDGDFIALVSMRAHERWIMRADSGAAFSIRPDPSPPRA